MRIKAKKNTLFFIKRNGLYVFLVLLLSFNKTMSQNTFSDLEIFLCIGQSNMAGRASIEAQDTGLLEDVYLLNASANWEQAENPLNQFSTIRGGLSMQKLGPSWEFGKTLQSYGKRVGLVVNAKGGSSISQWAEGTTFFNQAVARALAAQTAGGTIKGIIWHQGESDQGNTNYAADFTAMILALRKALSIPDLPVIAGQIRKWQGKKNINTIISKLKNTISNVDFASSTGLFHLGDNSHFDSESQRQFGVRYAQKYLELTDQVNGNTDIIVLEDTHVQGGSQANNVLNGNLLRVRKTTSEGSTRKTWLKFDLSNYTSVSNVFLNLSGNNTQTNFTVSVFEGPDDWDEKTLTRNNQPTKGALITTFNSPVTGSNVYNLIENIDITSYVQAQLNGDKIITLVLEDTTDDDVQLRITNSEDARINNPAPFLKVTSTTLAVNKNDIMGFKAYPNPVNSTNGYRLELFSPTGIENIQIFSLVGREIKSFDKIKSNTYSLDFSAIKSSGIYFVKVQDNKGSKTIRKVIKN
ncbi:MULTISPECIES: sialate O-acetylesterase [unclassified Polaribacter]|uniref:sialate O-acetylesterase n=1 Tax=unclassified Polaribacter TaxID=196858 RepID=UPI0011BE3794|nr:MULTISPECIES: sialate O-acetylesterase [unclassified Polaribacter]TXD53273.1 DNRLRE domain-containing protein [Polaribacter sp. IC063]TXD60273.1 DNRLRE domain-containing protein [Polaribacter sp. IC066]